MSITIELSAEEEMRLQKEAAAQGQSVSDFVKGLAQRKERIADTSSRSPFGPADGNVDPTGRVYDAAAAIAFVRELQNAAVPDDEPEDSWERLQKSIDEDRPGQRSIFGTGINPFPDDYVPREASPDWVREHLEDTKE